MKNSHTFPGLAISASHAKSKHRFAGLVPASDKLQETFGANELDPFEDLQIIVVHLAL